MRISLELSEDKELRDAILEIARGVVKSEIRNMYEEEIHKHAESKIGAFIESMEQGLRNSNIREDVVKKLLHELDGDSVFFRNVVDAVTKEVIKRLVGEIKKEINRINCAKNNHSIAYG